MPSHPDHPPASTAFCCQITASLQTRAISDTTPPPPPPPPPLLPARLSQSLLHFRPCCCICMRAINSNTEGAEGDLQMKEAWPSDCASCKILRSWNVCTVINQAGKGKESTQKEGRRAAEGTESDYKCSIISRTDFLLRFPKLLTRYYIDISSSHSTTDWIFCPKLFTCLSV